MNLSRVTTLLWEWIGLFINWPVSMAQLTSFSQLLSMRLLTIELDDEKKHTTLMYRQTLTASMNKQLVLRSDISSEVTVVGQKDRHTTDLHRWVLVLTVRPPVTDDLVSFGNRRDVVGHRLERYPERLVCVSIVIVRRSPFCGTDKSCRRRYFWKPGSYLDGTSVQQQSRVTTGVINADYGVRTVLSFFFIILLSIWTTTTTVIGAHGPYLSLSGNGERKHWKHVTTAVSYDCDVVNSHLDKFIFAFVSKIQYIL